MSNMFYVRFWNKANECIMVGGKHEHVFESYEDALDSANALLRAAYRLGAVEMDINNEFFTILDD